MWLQRLVEHWPQIRAVARGIAYGVIFLVAIALIVHTGFIGPFDPGVAALAVALLAAIGIAHA